MDHFDDRGQGVVLRAAMTAGARGENEQRRPESLAAAADDVFGDLPDQDHIRGKALAQDAIDCLHVVVQGTLEQRDGHGLRIRGDSDGPASVAGAA